MGLFTTTSWGAQGSKGWKPAKEEQAKADKKNGTNQTVFARRKAAAKGKGK